MKILLVLLLLNVLQAIACEVTMPHQMVVFSEDQSGQSIFQSKNCDSATLRDLHQIILATEGRMAAYQIQEMMSSKGHQLNVQPQSVMVQNLRSLIREQVLLPPGVHVKSTRGQNTPGILGLPAGDRLEVQCTSCLFGTQQPINVTVHGFDGSRQTIWASADFKKMVKAYRLVGPLSSFSTLSETSSLREEYVEEIPHTDLITDPSTLKFYVTNKPLRAGDLLRRSDLNAVNLVRAGLKTEVVLENQLVRIKTQGISRSNGSIGEFVEVFHPQKNKKYQGKVIDINKVLVEL